MAFIWINIISFLFMAAIFIAIIICDRKQAKLELQNIKLIVLAGILVALTVVLNTTMKLILNSFIPADIFEAKLGNFTLILISFFCGGVIGFFSGIAADFLALLVYSTGTPNLFFTLTSVMWCVVPYYAVRGLSKFYCRKNTIYFYLPILYAINLLLISATTPIILKYMGVAPSKGWWAFYLPRIIKYPLDVTVNSILLLTSYRVLVKSSALSAHIYQPQPRMKAVPKLAVRKDND